MSIVERKADTHCKIQLGGLIIKAGLAGEELPVLLGMLIAGSRVLKSPSAPDSRRRWKEIGDRTDAARRYKSTGRAATLALDRVLFYAKSSFHYGLCRVSLAQRPENPGI
jgi:hypothetical protein